MMLTVAMSAGVALICACIVAILIHFQFVPNHRLLCHGAWMPPYPDVFKTAQFACSGVLILTGVHV